MTGGSTVEGVRIVKRFNGAVALNDVSLTVAAGELVGIAGSNGAGKSTLGRILAGFVRPDSGTALIGGMDSMRYRREQGIGFMPEETGRDWGDARIGDVLALCGSPGVDLHTHELVEALHLVPLLGNRVAKASKGQWRATLAVAALIRRPALVVLDEPDAGLDPLAISRLSAAIRRVASEGSAIVVLSHRLDELARVANRILFMRAGAIVDELRRGPDGFPSLHERYAARMSEAA